MTVRKRNEMSARFRGTRPLAFAAVALWAAAALLVVSTAGATFRGPNGRLAFEAQAGPNRQLFTIGQDGTGLRQVTHFRDSGGTNAAWSKDGTKIAFSRHWDQGGPNEKLVLYTMNADGSGLKALRKGGDIAVEPSWFPDGRRIIFLEIHSSKLMVVNAGGTGLRPAGVPGLGGDSVCVFPDGKRVAFLRSKPGDDGMHAIFVAGLFGRGLKRITPWGGYADKLDCSPDGKRIVFSKPEFSHDGQSSNVFTVNADGTGEVQLTHETGGTVNAGADSWSPDGTKIAYVSNASGTYQVWIMNTDGTGQTQLTNAAEAHLAAWGAHP